jgi:hypothetical protein
MMRFARAASAATGALLVLAAASSASAQRRQATDAEVVARSTLVAAGDRVEIYRQGVSVVPAFLTAAQEAYRRLETLTGRTLDTATLGPKIRIYVSDAVFVSHVWKGYAHPSDPKAIVLLSARAYEGALTRTNATYVHEMAHLFTWRYHSHTLREGLADYLALQMHPGAGVGPNADGYDHRTAIPPEVAEYLGTTKPPPAWLGSDIVRRRAYYFASYRFVTSLIERAGMETFLRLYDAERTEDELVALYGATREELVRRAGM